MTHTAGYTFEVGLPFHVSTTHFHAPFASFRQMVDCESGASHRILLFDLLEPKVIAESVP